MRWRFAPTYYLQTDAPLYYYSFIDAAIAMAYKSLLGRIVRPVKDQLAIIDRALGDDASLKHFYFDISWDETAKYITASPEAIEATAALINKYPDRFIFGSDVVAPSSIDSPMKVYNLYEPLWSKLSPEVSEKVRLGNYARLFDAARISVRAWEKANTK